MEKFSKSKKSIILGVAFILILSIMFSMSVTAADDEIIDDNETPRGNLPPGYSDYGDGETIPDATVPLADIKFTDGDEEDIPDVTVPLADTEIPDDPKTNPITGDKILLFVILASISLTVISTNIKTKKKPI